MTARMHQDQWLFFKEFSVNLRIWNALAEFNIVLPLRRVHVQVHARSSFASAQRKECEQETIAEKNHNLRNVHVIRT